MTIFTFFILKNIYVLYAASLSLSLLEHAGRRSAVFGGARLFSAALSRQARAADADRQRCDPSAADRSESKSDV